MSFKETSLGLLYEDKGLICIFGNKNANIEALKKEFPNLNFTRIKQVHDDAITESKPNEDLQSTADAHYSQNTNHALCVSTADCMPILLYSEKKKIIFAIHAGWRGVENRILPKSIQKLKELGADPAELKIFIGPHISFSSFEVGKDVKDQLMNSTKNAPATTAKKISSEKYKVNLLTLVELQLKEFPIIEKQIQQAIHDTFTNLDFHSYRRDKEKSGRQLSFIAMKN